MATYGYSENETFCRFHEILKLKQMKDRKNKCI